MLLIKWHESWHEAACFCDVSLRLVFTLGHTHTHTRLDTHTLAVGCGLTHETEQGNIHCAIGKTGFETAKIQDNLIALLRALNAVKPKSVGGQVSSDLPLFRPPSLPPSLSSSLPPFLPPSLPPSRSPRCPPSLPISLCPSPPLAFPLADRVVGSGWSGGGGVASDIGWQ